MAPASLVAPLGAVTVIANTVFSRVLLKEPMPRQKAAGVVLALIGAIMIALGAPSEFPVDSEGQRTVLPEEEFFSRILTWRALCYILVLVVVVFSVSNPLKFSFLVSEETRKEVVLVPCVLCGCAGAMTVAAAKAVFQVLSQSFAGNLAMLARPDICWLTYVTIIVAVGSIVSQVKYLNEALKYHGSSRVVPVYYVTFTVVTMSAGMTFFQELDFDPFLQSVALFAVGLAFAFGGVWLINSLAEDGDGCKDMTPEGEQEQATLDATTGFLHVTVQGEQFLSPFLRATSMADGIPGDRRLQRTCELTEERRNFIPVELVPVLDLDHHWLELQDTRGAGWYPAGIHRPDVEHQHKMVSCRDP